MAQIIKAVRKNVKTEKVFLRITPNLKRKLIAQSEEKGYSVSGYIRFLIESNEKKTGK